MHRKSIFTAVSLLMVPVIALGHATVHPLTALPGAYERYVLRVPNEKDVPTTRVEIRFPADVRVISFSEVPGWRLEVLTDSARNVIGAVWVGSLAPQRFVEFPLFAVNPRSEATLVWPTYQTYADGERVEWTGPEGSDRPAASTRVGALDGSSRGNASWAQWTAIAALLLALVSVGLALRPR